MTIKKKDTPKIGSHDSMRNLLASIHYFLNRGELKEETVKAISQEIELEIPELKNISNK